MHPASDLSQWETGGNRKRLRVSLQRSFNTVKGFVGSNYFEIPLFFIASFDFFILSSASLWCSTANTFSVMRFTVAFESLLHSFTTTLKKSSSSSFEFSSNIVSFAP